MGKGASPDLLKVESCDRRRSSLSPGGVLNVGLTSTFLCETERGEPESKDTKESRASADCDPVMIGLELEKTLKIFELFHFLKNFLSPGSPRHILDFWQPPSPHLNLGFFSS